MAKSAGKTAGSKAFDELNEQMLTRLFDINPDSASTFGRHDPYDQMLPHGGFKRLQDTMDLLVEWDRKATEVSGEEDISRDQAISLEVLHLTIDTYRFVIKDFPLWRMFPNALETPGSVMLLNLLREYAPYKTRIEWMTAKIGQFPRYLGQFRERYSGVRTPAEWTEMSLNSCDNFPMFLDMIQEQASKKLKGATVSDLEKNIRDAKGALDEHSEWLRGLLANSTNGFAMGREKYEKLLKIKRMGFTADELLFLAQKYLKEMKLEIAIVSKKIAKGGGYLEALRVVETDSPKDTAEVIERTNSENERALKFIKEKDLITVPRASGVLVLRTPDFLEDDVPTAATYLPAIFEKKQDSVYLVTDQKTPEGLRSTWNNSAIINTVVHEAWPGHHLQGVKSNKKPWMHQLPHIVASSDTLVPPYESQEGWAHYCEMMMYEKGFCGTDKDHFTMLQLGIWRAHRVVSDVRLCSGETNIDQIVKMLVNDTGIDRRSIEGEVRGFSRTPGYGMCYLVGRHLVLDLKVELQKELGDGFDERRFHDLIAENGNLPFSLLRQEVRFGMGL